ncbi:hypothetical protein BC827DRAFT_1224645 [Russula dissimulans]|nr:hypothetical protein BC827DRAFT_1224645 [Russula dissimulans]
MACPILSVAIVILTLSSEQIVDGSINLDPDYQREQEQISGSQDLMELGRCVQTSDQGLW